MSDPSSWRSSDVVVEARELSCGYDPAAPTLTGCNLTLRRSEIVCILGRSGSGKSTLLKTLGGSLPPLAGEVRLFGEPFYDLSDREQSNLLRRTGTLFQHGALFGSMSLLDNVALPICELTSMPSEVARELAMSKLAMVDVAGAAYRLPSGVSGGQRKRAALARALALDPAILFCDEPTSGLDPVTSGRIDDALLRLRDAFGVAILAVTHDTESVRAIADYVLVVGEGAVRAEGRTDELARSDDPTIYSFFHRGRKLDGEKGKAAE